MKYLSIERSRPLLYAALSAALLVSCSKEPVDPTTQVVTEAHGTPKLGGHHFLTVDAGWNAAYGSHPILFDCYDGACNFLGTLQSNWNSTTLTYSPIHYADCIYPRSFSAADQNGNLVTFQWGTHNWIVPSDGQNGQYEVLELDILDFAPCMYTACNTPRWNLSWDNIDPLAVWGYATNDPNCHGAWDEKKYLWHSEAHPPFTPCGSLAVA